MFVIAAFNQWDKKAVHYTAIKSIEALHRNLDKAFEKGATIISIRKLRERRKFSIPASLIEDDKDEK